MNARNNTERRSKTASVAVTIQAVESETVEAQLDIYTSGTSDVSEGREETEECNRSNSTSEDVAVSEFFLENQDDQSGVNNA